MADGRDEMLSDAQLVARILDGERDRYATLVARHQAALYRHALGMVGSEDAAADLAQESLIAAYSRLDDCRDPARFGSWVFRILRNRCLDYLKDHRRRTIPLTEDTAFAADDDDPGARLDRAELQRAVLNALDALPDAQREAFLLKHVEDRSYEEMSEMLGASVSALKMRVMRAREVLQAILSRHVHPM